MVSRKRKRVPTGLVYDEVYLKHQHPKRRHIERPERLSAIIEHLQENKMLQRVEIIKSHDINVEGEEIKCVSLGEGGD